MPTEVQKLTEENDSIECHICAQCTRNHTHTQRDTHTWNSQNNPQLSRIHYCHANNLEYYCYAVGNTHGNICTFTLELEREKIKCEL